MDRQEQVRQQRQIIDGQRRRYYEMNPDVDRWVRRKRVIRNTALIYCALHTIITIILMLLTEPSGSIVMEAAKLLFQMLWICVFISPEGSWRFSLILYLWALTNFTMTIRYIADIADSTAYIFRSVGNFVSAVSSAAVTMTAVVDLSYQLLYGVVLIMELMAPLLFLAAAVYLTAFPMHREWSERASEFQKQMTESIKQLGR